MTAMVPVHPECPWPLRGGEKWQKGLFQLGAELRRDGTELAGRESPSVVAGWEAQDEIANRESRAPGLAKGEGAPVPTPDKQFTGSRAGQFNTGAQVRRDGNLPCGLNYAEAAGWVAQDVLIQQMKRGQE